VVLITSRGTKCTDHIPQVHALRLTYTTFGDIPAAVALIHVRLNMCDTCFFANLLLDCVPTHLVLLLHNLQANVLTIERIAPNLMFMEPNSSTCRCVYKFDMFRICESRWRTTYASNCVRRTPMSIPCSSKAADSKNSAHLSHVLPLVMSAACITGPSA
jgi:hypothetical protein